MPDSASFAVRRSVLEADCTWTVDDGGLRCSSGESAHHMAFSDIAAVRIEWTGSRFDHGRYTVNVKGRGGASATIVSTHYAGFAQFEDRSASFTPFLRTLVRLTAQHNPACAFYAGAPLAKYIFNIAALAVGLFLFVLVAALVGVPLTWLIIVKIIVIVSLLPLALRWLKANRPRRFTPPDIPPDVLPALAKP